MSANRLILIGTDFDSPNRLKIYNIEPSDFNAIGWVLFVELQGFNLDQKYIVYDFLYIEA